MFDVEQLLKEIKKQTNELNCLQMMFEMRSKGVSCLSYKITDTVLAEDIQTALENAIERGVVNLSQLNRKREAINELLNS